MSEFKGTKGCWSFDKEDFSVTTKGDYKSPTEICHVMDNNPYEGIFEEDVANGHLIAAAPELLEALQSSRWYVKQAGQLSSDAFALLDSIDAAIAKALGQ